METCFIFYLKNSLLYYLNHSSIVSSNVTISKITYPLSNLFSHIIETIQLIYRINRFTSFYMVLTFVVNELSENTTGYYNQVLSKKLGNQHCAACFLGIGWQVERLKVMLLIHRTDSFKSFLNSFKRALSPIPSQHPAGIYLLSNMFKVNNKDTRATSLTLLWCLYSQLWTDFWHCSVVCIVDFKQVNFGWTVR